MACLGDVAAAWSDYPPSTCETGRDAWAKWIVFSSPRSLPVRVQPICNLIHDLILDSKITVGGLGTTIT
jgi:hypothetical protein